MRCVNRKWIQSLILLAIPSFTASAQVATPGSPFTATWSASGASAVAPAWQGTINVTGAAYPSSSEGNITTTWNFSTLTDGKLPAGTLVNFGDLDDGSGQTEE